MSTKVQDVEDELQRRLDIGTGESAITDANLFDVMNKVQQTINFALRRRITTGTFTAATTKTALFYTTTAIAADCLQVQALYLSTRTIMRLPSWTQMKQYDRNWWSTGGAAGRVEAWSHVGHNAAVIYPGVKTANTTLTCVYLQDTTTLNSSDDLFYLGDHDMALVYDLCEIILLAHMRRIPECVERVKKLEKDIIPYLEGGEWV